MVHDAVDHQTKKQQTVFSTCINGNCTLKKFLSVSYKLGNVNHITLYVDIKQKCIVVLCISEQGIFEIVLYKDR